MSGLDLCSPFTAHRSPFTSRLADTHHHAPLPRLRPTRVRRLVSRSGGGAELRRDRRGRSRPSGHDRGASAGSSCCRSTSGCCSRGCRTSRLKRWVRQGVISKAWLGTGEEATTVGPVFALDPAVDYVSPMIRNQSACGDMGMPIGGCLPRLSGRGERPLARPRRAHRLDAAPRDSADLAGGSDGAGMRRHRAGRPRMRGEAAVVLTWIGDGSAKAGVAHEGLNFAAVQRAPGDLHRAEQPGGAGNPARSTSCRGQLRGLARGLRHGGLAFDGNHVLDAYAATRLAVDRCRAGRGR